jgi:hypothetical protein
MAASHSVVAVCAYGELSLYVRALPICIVYISYERDMLHQMQCLLSICSAVTYASRPATDCVNIL